MNVDEREVIQDALRGDEGAFEQVIHRYTARVEREPVQISLTLLPEDASRKQVSLMVLTRAVEPAQDAVKAATAKFGGEILNSSLARADDGRGGMANLAVRVPAKNYAALLGAFKKTGVVAQFAVQRDESNGREAPEEPVRIALTLTDIQQPVQTTQAAVLTPEAEARANRIKEIAAAAPFDIRASTFERNPDGRQSANLVFRLPLEKYPAFIQEIEGLGKVKELSILRRDRPQETAEPGLAIAEVFLRLFSEGDVVTPDNGLFAMLRKTLGQGVDALMWSLRMIGVALAFIAPWALALAALTWIFRRVRRAKK